MLVLSDTPIPGVHIPECLAKNLKRVDNCMRPLSASVNAVRMRTEQWVARETGVAYQDTTGWVCTAECPPVVGDVLVYLDNNHLTNTYASFLGPYLELAIKSEL